MKREGNDREHHHHHYAPYAHVWFVSSKRLVTWAFDGELPCFFFFYPATADVNVDINPCRLAMESGCVYCFWP